MYVGLLSPSLSHPNDSLLVLRSGKTTSARPTSYSGQSSEQRPPVQPTRTGNPQEQPDRVEYDVIAHLRRIPARLSVYEALQLSKEARDALINALVNENIRATYLAQQAEILECSETVTFTDDDMMLGEKLHNRPLFVSGDLAGERIGRILLDPGSAVNILPLKTLERVGFTPSQLKDTSLTIHGFNSGGQGSLGTILLDQDIQGFLTQVNCHVIDAPTSYNLLLGRPWLHRYKVVPRPPVLQVL